MNERTDPKAPPRAIEKSELGSVIRRAAELYMDDTTRETVDESELLAIADEIGLPERYVRQALYERVRPREASLVDRVWGPGHVVLHRAVADDEAVVLRRVEDYLVAEQYLRLERRHGERRVFVPGDDAVTRALRVLTRPRRRYPLARVRQVEVAVRPIEPHRSHVTVAVDLGDRRRKSVRSSLLGGGVVSALLGAGVGVPVGILMAHGAGPEVGALTGALSGITTFTVGFGAAAATGARRFRRRVTAMRGEVEVVLNRLEHGLRLGPGPAPWRRRLGR